jgi:hypothetical protein
VGRYKSANLIREKPSGTSAPFNSTVEAGIVGIGVKVSVSVGCGTLVSVRNKVGVCAGMGEITVLVSGPHPTRKTIANTRSLFNNYHSSTSS